MKGNPIVKQLTTFLNSEFSARKGYADPKIVFRAKDVVAGSLSIRQITRNVPKRQIARVHGQRREMGKLLSEIATSTGYIAGFRLITIDTPEAAKGAKYMAVLEGSTHDKSHPVNTDVTES